uniref:Smc6_2 protein n=1 Tax=Fopius arisanus TaxID=64838 RepID=A0A0C9RF88_9HYME
MSSQTNQKKKRKNQHSLDEEVGRAKRSKDKESGDESLLLESLQGKATAGRIKKLVLRNFFCHDHLVMEFNKNVNFIVGRNGSGKSAILTAITIGLGGRASTTERGDSFKTFIKSGKVSCTIEITLINEGPKAYEPEIYGKVIKVVRTISETSSKVIIKGQRDNLVSKRKADLLKITSALNIQVDNPISILNQNAAKKFLIQPKGDRMYELFMQATQLNIIGKNYKEALQISKETQTRMQDTQRELQKNKNEIEAIEEKIKAIDNLESVRKKYEELECECLWARVIAQEARVNAAEKACVNGERTVEELVTNADQNYNGKAEKIDGKIAEITEHIRESEKEAATCESAWEEIRNKYQGKKDGLAAKEREYKACKQSINRTLKDLDTINTEIVRLEQLNSQAYNEKAQLEQHKISVEAELREVEQRIKTAQVDQVHINSDKLRLEMEEREYRVDVNQKEHQLGQLQAQLGNLSLSSSNSLDVYGRDMIRLLKRIDEENRQQHFEQRPRGPIGAAIKMKDSSWTPIVEKAIGNLISGFCVDNRGDAQLLGKLIQEVYSGQKSPEIICSKFLDRVHDVRNNSTRTERYCNVFDIMEVSDPVIANCLIDQRSPESILLIPTSDEAAALLKDRENVPQNCKMALTKTGETFYPDPNYRTYSGYISNPRYLQVSTAQVVQSLKKEIREIQEEFDESKKLLTAKCEALHQSRVASKNLFKKITQLRGMLNKLSAKADELKDKLSDRVQDNGDNHSHFISLRSEYEQRLEQLRIEEQRLGDEVKELQGKINEIETELTRCREKANDVDELINPLKMRIRKLEEEKRQCQIQMKEANNRILSARHSLEQAVAEKEYQKGTLQVFLDHAEGHSRRIETSRTEEEINEEMKKRTARIALVENKYGTRDVLYEQLEIKKTRYLEVEQVLDVLLAANDQHLQRVENRRKEYKDMRSEMGERVQNAFSAILILRGYKGSLIINYVDKTLDLSVIPQNTTGRDRNETITLSGGERSYSTVAFVLALWECTAVPFYFLDEFDVFMDKVNRRIIMEILLLHTRDHPECQFGFFTPLDASIVRSSDSLTIHQLEAPERQLTQNNR